MDVIRCEQQTSRMVRDLVAAGKYDGRLVMISEGISYVEHGPGRRIVLPASLWHAALKEHHESVWAGPLRIDRTLERVGRQFWWPRMAVTVRNWVLSCRDCGSKKVRPKEIVPPLRSVRVGAVGDRWGLDLAGPLPITSCGNRYVVVRVEYLTKMVVAVPIANKTAEVIARVLLERVVYQHGPFRELLTDNASELVGEVVSELVRLLQAKQTSPVPYRPNLMGLVERFNRTWKDMVAMYVNESQNDWDKWLAPCTYAYNVSRHVFVVPTDVRASG